MHPLVVKAERFSDALALVVATANSNGVHATAVAFRLRMHLWIAVHLTRAGQEQPSTDTPGQTQHVVGAKKAGLRGFDRIELVMNR